MTHSKTVIFGHLFTRHSLGPCWVCGLPVVLLLRDGRVPVLYVPDENGGRVWHQECRESLPPDDKPSSVREADGANP